MRKTIHLAAISVIALSTASGCVSKPTLRFNGNIGPVSYRGAHVPPPRPAYVRTTRPAKPPAAPIRTSVVQTAPKRQSEPAAKLAAAETEKANDRPWCLRSLGQGALCALGAVAAISVLRGSGSDTPTTQSADASPSDDRSSGRPLGGEPDYKPKDYGDHSLESGVDGCFWGSVLLGTCH